VVPVPRAVFILAFDQGIESLLAVLLPGEPVAALVVGEQLVPAVLPQGVDGLGVVVVGVLVVAHAAGAVEQRHAGLAEAKPLLDQRGVVPAGRKATADGSRGQGRPATAPVALCQAVADAAVGAG